MAADSQRDNSKYNFHQALVMLASSVGLLRLIGYSLLLMAISNWVDILIPPKFMDPTWELQTAGAFVESAPIPLLALALIFYGENIKRHKVEKILVRLLSYGCLLIAVLYISLIPISATSTIRINQQIDVQIGEAFSQQVNQLNQLESQLSQTSDADIADILRIQGISIGTEQNASPKDQLLGYLTEIKQTTQSQAETSKADRKRSNFKSAFKWMFGASIASFTFFYIWNLTKWARTIQPHSAEGFRVNSGNAQHQK